VGNHFFSIHLKNYIFCVKLIIISNYVLHIDINFFNKYMLSLKIV